MNADETLQFLAIDAARHALLSALIGAHIKGNALLIQHVKYRGLKERYLTGGIFAEEGSAIVERCERENELCHEMLQDLR